MTIRFLNGKPLFAPRTGGVGTGPAWNDECCCGDGDGDGEPEILLSPGVTHDCGDVYSWCMHPATELHLTLSGFTDCSWSGTESVNCEPFGFVSKDCYCDNTISALNGGYTLTKYDEGFDGGLFMYYASFEVALGTYADPDDRGVLVDTCSCDFGDWQPVRSYCYGITATVRCTAVGGVSGVLAFWDIQPFIQAFNNNGDSSSQGICCFNGGCFPGFPVPVPTAGGTPCGGSFTSSFNMALGLCSTGTAYATGVLMGGDNPMMQDENGDTLSTEDGDNIMRE